MSVQYGSSFTFDGVQTTAYGVWISGIETYAAPERDVETVTVPGRNGLLTLDNGRYKNIKITYPCFMADNFDTDFGAFKAAMLSKVGYKQLTDTYHPEGFRLARLVGGFSPETGILNKSAHFEVQFDCYPQFYLNSGQNYVTVANNGTITNPTSFPSSPMIRVTFSTTPRDGTVTVNGRTVVITAAGGTNVYIDCDSQDAYRIGSTEGIVSQNGKITVADGFPFLSPGANLVAYTGNISSVSIIPRWWTL